MSNKFKATQQPWSCEHCGKSGKNRANYKRDHGLRCPVHINNVIENTLVKGIMYGSTFVTLLAIALWWVV